MNSLADPSLLADPLALDLSAVCVRLPPRAPGTGTTPLPEFLLAMELVRIGHCALRVTDVEASKAFYCGLLGFR